MANKIGKHYDYVLVGYNLSSLTYGYKLFKQGKDFCIIDSRQVSNCDMKYLSKIEASVYSRIPFAPIEENTLNDIEPDLVNLLGENKIFDGTPVTFEKGNFKSFLGFGNNKVQAQDEVDRYCHPKSVSFTNQPEKIWKYFSEKFSDQVFLDQELTDIIHENGKLTELMLNGNHKITSNQFVFFDQFPALFEKIGQVSKKAASQFGKITWWSSANLIMHHEQLPANVELNQTYLLMGSKQQACLGLFSELQGHFISRWESFFPAELTPDSETTGTVVKEIKKQFKRAFPEEEDHKPSEHILIHQSACGDLSSVPLEDGKLSNLSNLQLCSPAFESKSGWLSEILCAWNLPILTRNTYSETGSESLIEVAAPRTPC